MSYDAQRTSIQQRFNTQFSAAHAGVPIVFENLSAAKPVDGYVLLSILNGEARLRGLGMTRLYRYPGVISVDIFVPLKQGIKNADLYAQTVDDIFRGQSFDGILCRAAQRTDLGKEENYWRVNVSIPFQRDELG